MDASELSEEQRDTLKRLKDDSSEETILMEHLNPLIALGICRRGDDGVYQLTELGEDVYDQIVGHDSDL